MPARHAPVAPRGQYIALHITGAGTAVPVGQPVNTTATTAVAAPGDVVITPASMANISVGMALVITGGVGTAEVVPVKAIQGATFTATFANTHSGTYTIRSMRSVDLGPVIFNQLGTAMTLTLYNGDPALAAIFPNAVGYGAMAVITPASAPFPFAAVCDYGLFYTYTGTTPGDVTLHYSTNMQ